MTRSSFRSALASWDHIEALEALHPLNPPGLHRARLYGQEEHAHSYWILWQEEVPIGRGLINWAGSRDPKIRAALPRCPEIFDLFVKDGCRSQGAGSQLLQHLESRARDRGFERIGLGVGVENSDARRLYDRCGYQSTDLADYTDAWTELDHDGVERTKSQTCSFLVKALSPQTGGRLE